MSALYPDIFIRPHDPARAAYTQEDLRVYGVELHDGWDRLENVEMGVKTSVAPGVMKMLGTGTQRVISEKISLELTLLFMTKALLERYRSAMVNQDIDVLLYDGVQGMWLVYYRVNLNLVSELTSGDTYMLKLSMGDVQKPVDAGVGFFTVSAMVLVSGQVVDENGDPLEGVTVIMSNSTSKEWETLTDADGIYLFFGEQGDTVDIGFELEGYNTETFEDVEMHNNTELVLPTMVMTESE